MMRTDAILQHNADVIAMIEKLGPDEDEYPVINTLVNQITSKDEARVFREMIEPVLSGNTLYGYTYTKPMGYAGDYLLIEKIYQQYVSNDPRWKKWDIYYHSHEATKAVRNRKDYFIRLMEELCSHKRQPRVLILGSGPATDVYEFFERNPHSAVSFDLLDIDQRAIDYASEKNSKYLDRINFIRMNVLRFSPGEKYDLIWSAGLFDYLNDRYFTGLISRFKNNLLPSGEMVIGNFSDFNPTRRVMEIVGEWYLIHRNSEKLTQLAVEAGISRDAVYVDKEPLGINLFMRIKPGYAPERISESGTRKRIYTSGELYSIEQVY